MSSRVSHDTPVNWYHLKRGCQFGEHDTETIVTVDRERGSAAPDQQVQDAPTQEEGTDINEGGGHF